jgi:3-oxoacyl-[acyl-carrier-protein] synthase-1
MKKSYSHGSVREPYPVTAYAAANALGGSTKEVIAALRAGRTGLRPCPLDLPFAAPSGAMPDPLPRLPEALAAHDSRTARLALIPLEEIMPAVRAAVARHGSDRVGLVLGTTTAGLVRTEDAYHWLARTGALPADYDLHRQHSFGAVLEIVRKVASLGGPGHVVSTACSASAKAIGSAQRLIASGRADAVLVGGVDGLCQTTLRGFHSLQILSGQPCRPLSSERNGINIGEGAAYLLIERTGDSELKLLGVGESSDAYHMSAPHPEGQGALAAMREALERAGMGPDEVDHINAHSPGTRLNDYSEARAIATLFGARVPVASTKGYTGHMLGAGGATEAVFSLVALAEGWIPASAGADPVDGSLGIEISTAVQHKRCRAVMSNSFAFGGNNVSVLFGRSS